MRVRATLPMQANREKSFCNRLQKLHSQTVQRENFTMSGSEIVVGGVATERQWLNTKQAADYLHVTEGFLSADRCNKKVGIPYYKMGSRVLYDRKDLDETVRKNRVE